MSAPPHADACCIFLNETKAGYWEAGIAWREFADRQKAQEFADYLKRWLEGEMQAAMDRIQ